MSCRIILVRHGQSLGNSKRIFCGHEDIGLSDLGYKQAELTCEYLSNVKIDKIYSSDLSRAYDTALPLSKKKGINIVKSKNLREIFAGDWEGKSVEVLMSQYNETYSVWKQNIGLARPNNGESVFELQQRIKSQILNIAKAHDNETVAVFTHATPIRTLFAYIRGLSLQEIKDIPWINNASISEIIVDNNAINEVLYGYDEFMGELSSAVPKNM